MFSVLGNYCDDRTFSKPNFVRILLFLQLDFSKKDRNKFSTAVAKFCFNYFCSHKRLNGWRFSSKFNNPTTLAFLIILCHLFNKISFFSTLWFALLAGCESYWKIQAILTLTSYCKHIIPE